jgi:hypothetical protein
MARGTMVMNMISRDICFMGNMDEGLHSGIEWKALEVCSSELNQWSLGFAVANLGNGTARVNLYDRKLRMLKRTKDPRDTTKLW